MNKFWVLSCFVNILQFCERFAIDWVGHVLKVEISCFGLNLVRSGLVLYVLQRSVRITTHVAVICLKYVIDVK